MIRWTTLTIGLYLFIAGCSGGLEYAMLERHMAKKDCSFAIDYIKKNAKNYGKNQRLLYYLDSSVVNMLCGNFEESNRFLHKAEALADDLWTKSISKEAASFLINDYIKPYAGEDFERVLIHLLSAINYSMLEKGDDALVEIRRLDSLLSLYNSKYEKKNVYKEDAFGRFLSGILYEADRSLDDSFIDYLKSAEIYRSYETDYHTPTPSILVNDLVRLAKAVDRVDEIRPFVSDIKGNTATYRETKKLGRLVFINLNGKSPLKKEDKIFIPTRTGPITLAFPRYVMPPESCHVSSVLIESKDMKKEARSELVEDIRYIAVKNLSDRKGRVIARAVARAVVKQAALEAASSQIKNEAVKDLSKLLFNVVNTVIERADTRTWKTLPGQIYMASAFLNEGEYDLSVKMCSGEKRSYKKVLIRAGRTKFILFETIY